MTPEREVAFLRRCLWTLQDIVDGKSEPKGHEAEEITPIIEKFKAQRDLIKSLEWAGNVMECPACPNCGNEPHEGHTPTCLIKEALGE